MYGNKKPKFKESVAETSVSLKPVKVTSIVFSVPEEEVNKNQHYLGNRMRKKGVMEVLKLRIIAEINRIFFIIGFVFECEYT